MSAPDVKEASAAPRAAQLSPLAMQLRLSADGPAIAVEEVLISDLSDAIAEGWFDILLRRGQPDVALQDVRARLRPVWRESDQIGRYCAGFELGIRGANDGGQVCFFSRHAFEHVAARGAQRLMAEGTLQPGETYYYAMLPTGGETQEIWLHGPEGRPAPGYLRVPLAPLLARAERVGGFTREGSHPVFLTRDAYARAELVSRKGGEQHPPVESGGLFVGPLCVDPESGEMFSVIVDFIEAVASEATTFSLTYSNETWINIQTILQHRRGEPRMRHDRIQGQAHAHSFLPAGGAAPCEACMHVDVCTRTTAVLSDDDRSWARAVLSAEAFQCHLIYGLDARGRRVEAFYGQRGGTLVRRDFHLIDAFEAPSDGA
jgi:hypothetical protein